MTPPVNSSAARAAAAVTLLALTAACSAPTTNSEQVPANTDDVAAQTTTESAEELAAATAEQPQVITIAAGGDILPHRAVLDSADLAGGPSGGFDFSGMFAEITPLVSGADLALCHLETPLSPDDTGLTQSGVLSFASPRSLADGLAGAGFDGCDFASNHTMDRGVRGLGDTEEVIRSAGLGYAGPTATADRAGEAQVYDVEGFDVAHLAYTYTLPNSGEPNVSVPGEAPWLERSLWPAIGSSGILADAGTAREEGADVVVVSMHWGQEYATDPTAKQVELADELLSSDDVDVILGTHVHVPQPCDTVDGRLVLYGLGNLLSNQSPQTAQGLRTETQEGMVAVVSLTMGPDGVEDSQLAVQPTRVDLDGHIVTPVGPNVGSDTAARTLQTVAARGCEVETLEP